MCLLLGCQLKVNSPRVNKKQLHIGHWGRNLRMALATVIVFWNSVEVAARRGFFREIGVDPMGHIVEMSIIAGVFVALVAGFRMYNGTDKN